MEDPGGKSAVTEGMNMEKRVLSWGSEGRSLAREGTVGPSFAEVWVVVTTGMERAFANLRSFCVVRTLLGWVSLGGDDLGERRTYMLSNS